MLSLKNKPSVSIKKVWYSTVILYLNKLYFLYILKLIFIFSLVLKNENDKSNNINLTLRAN